MMLPAGMHSATQMAHWIELYVSGSVEFSSHSMKVTNKIGCQSSLSVKSSRMQVNLAKRHLY